MIATERLPSYGNRLVASMVPSGSARTAAGGSRRMKRMGYLRCRETFPGTNRPDAHARPVRRSFGCLEPEQVDRAAVCVVERRTREPGAAGDANREAEPV